jgi:hypothetical protein
MEGVMEQSKRDQFILAIKRCIETTFSEAQWQELAYLSGAREIIYGHPRLLRSLSFGDEDYGGNILDVLEELAAHDLANLQVIEKFVKLPEWLKNNDPNLYQELYGLPNTQLAFIEGIHSSFELDQHVSRIRNSIQSDPELAIGSTKEMLETVMKSVLEECGVSTDKREMPELLKLVQKNL